MDLTIVVPLLDEADSLSELYSQIKSALSQFPHSYELIFVDDGSTDGSWPIIKRLSEADASVRGIRFQTNFGKSQALHAGFEMATGDVVMTMDADLQDSPEEIWPLYQMIASQGYDLVSGWKKVRYDNYWTKNLPSKLFNWAARKTSGLTLHDFNCGIKAYRKAVVKAIEVTGEMHRYIPVLVKNKGFSKIGEKVVVHRARKHGHTKFGSGRFFKGFFDLITIWFISRFGRNPMYFFGSWGLLMFFIGFCLTAYLGVDKLFINPKGSLLTSRPQFYLALVAMIAGIQFFLTGFLGDLILFLNPKKRHYVISEKI